MTAGNLERTKVGAGTGPPLFTPFKSSAQSSTKMTSEKKAAAESHTGQLKKLPGSRYPSKTSETSKRHQPYESSKSSFAGSRDYQRHQGRGEAKDKTRSEPVGTKKERETQRREGDVNSKMSRMAYQSQGSSRSKERGGDREDKLQTQSSGYHRKRTELKGGGREFNEPQGGSYPHCEIGRRGRGRGRNQRDPRDNHEASSLSLSTGDRLQHKVVNEPGESQDEGGRRGRGRGRGRRGRGRRNDDDDDYQPSSRPTTGLSLGDYFEQKLVLTDRDSSHFGWYEEDYMYDPYYEWEQPHDGMEEYGATYYTDHNHTHTHKTRAKEAWVKEEEEEYPPMPSAKSSSVSNTPQQQQQQVDPGESHWDWVSLAAGSGAPSTATKK